MLAVLRVQGLLRHIAGRAAVFSSTPTSTIWRLIHWPLTWKANIAGTCTVGVMRDAIAADLAQLGHVIIRIGEPFEAGALEHQIRKAAAQPNHHLVGEARHDAVDNDHRRHASVTLMIEASAIQRVRR